jgi:glucan phosphoethanolaminetransferase (alkaline phosphatase superfamily)
MMIILAVTSTLLELMIAAKIKWWRVKSYESKLFNMLNSLFLSFVIGLAFSASGLIAMGAGVISTVLSVPGYKFLHWNYDSEQAQKHNGNMMQHLKSKWLQTIKDFFTLVYKILRIITFPIWGTRWAVTKLKAIKTK